MARIVSIKSKIIIIGLIAGLFSIFSMKAFAATQQQHLEYPGAVWRFDFDAQVNVNKDGTASISITNIKQKYSQAWASLSISAVIKSVTRNAMGTVVVSTHIESIGRGRHWQGGPYGTGNDESYWVWGEPDKTETTLKWDPEFAFSAKDYPELREVQTFSFAQTPTAFSEGAATPAAPTIAESEEEFPTFTRILYISGEIFIKKKDGSWVEAFEGMDLEVGETIKTSAGAEARIVLAGTAFLKIRPESEFVIPEKAENSRYKIGFIQMIKGVLWARAKKEDNSLKVQTPNAVCGVRGTEFEVSYLDGKTCVEVFKGVVWLSGPDEKDKVEINEGQKKCCPQESASSDTQTQSTQSRGLVGGLVGGPCAYDDIKGTAKIISVAKTKESINQAKTGGGPGYEGYEVKFKFTPSSRNQQYDKKWQNSIKDILGREYTLQLTNSWYPGAKYLKKYRIARGKVFKCTMRLIKQGTCTPVIFDFPNINKIDYFESGK